MSEKETKLTPEKMGFYLELHGYVPWTATIADCLDRGIEWDSASIAKHLWNAQDKIDQLTKDKVALVQEVLELKVKK